MNTKRVGGGGFTLIELLVVIAIIAILATVSVPTIQTAQLRARMIRSTSDARNVVIALTAYASQNAGLYPQSSRSSNEAFRELFPAFADQERMFYLRSDRMFCDPQKEPDEEKPLLAPGECHWAYVSGLTDSHRSSTPILADGFTDGLGRYDQYHAWHRLDQAIVGRIDGSVQPMALNENGEVANASGEGNLFGIPEIVDDEMVQLLNPERPRRDRSAE